MAKRTKKAGLKVRVKTTPRTSKKAGRGKKEAGLAEELQESGEIKIDKESKKIILPGQEEKIERDKKLMMWTGVSFFMVLILGFWILNIKSIFKEAKDVGNNSSRFEWNKITNEFDQTMEQIKKGLEELKQMNITDNISTSTEDNVNTINLLLGDKSIGSSSPAAGEPTEESLEELKIRLKDLEQKLDNKN